MRIAAKRPGRRGGEWTRLLLQAIQSRPQVHRHLMRESSADFAAEYQAIPFVVPDEQRAQPCARSFGVGEAADDEFLALDALGLQPSAVSPGAVRKVTAFRDDALEVVTTRLGEEGITVAHHVLREANPSGLSRADELLQPRFPLLERQCSDARAVEPKKIKDEVDKRTAVGAR